MARKPDILIFNPDQFRADALAHLGCEGSITPYLDQTCETDGVSFSNAYCQNPVCTPSRCSFMTGWYPHVHGHRTMHYMLHPDEPMLLRTLKENGYFVWWGGKNDVIPGQFGHEAFCDVYNKPKREITGYGLHGHTQWRGHPDGDNYYSFLAGKVEPREGKDTYVDDDWAQVLDAIDFIKSYDGDKPLCVYLPILYPHPPYGVEEPYYSSIDRSKVKPPVKPYKNWEDKPSLLKGIWEGQRMQGWSEERMVDLKATYLGMCARVDTQYGMLLDTLRETGRYDDTAVFFFSDHGDFTGDYGLVEKTQNTFQDCLVRVPFLIKPPRSVPVQPRISDAMVELVDFSATVAELADIDLGHTAFGRTLVPLLEGRETEHRDAVFCEGGRMKDEWHCKEYQSIQLAGPTGLYMPRVSLQQRDGPEHTKAIMIRTKQWKYVYRVYEKHELYDLENDPNETENRIDDPAAAEVLASLKLRMLQYFVETADVVPYKEDERNFRS
ncbi:MAG: sulfatase-like hydrolase/transferase [Clostridiaceae bacterium]|jgi:arylsulfatase A-like enzyme|nr:sulfatase-like hydrolase/transferase [Clostridiaceae bacterium]